jgi:hypothetical protein
MLPPPKRVCATAKPRLPHRAGSPPGRGRRCNAPAVCTLSLGFAGKSHVRTTSRPADSQGTRTIDIPRYGIDFGSVTATRSEIRPSEHGRRRASTRRSPIHPRLFHGSGKEGSWIGTPLWLGHRVTGNDVSLQKRHKVFRPSCSGVPVGEDLSVPCQAPELRKLVEPTATYRESRSSGQALTTRNPDRPVWEPGAQPRVHAPAPAL